MKFFLGFLVGLISAAVIFAGVVYIASAINDITFAQQITQWFGEVSESAQSVGASFSFKNSLINFK